MGNLTVSYRVRSDPYTITGVRLDKIIITCAITYSISLVQVLFISHSARLVKELNYHAVQDTWSGLLFTIYKHLPVDIGSWETCTFVVKSHFGLKTEDISILMSLTCCPVECKIWNIFSQLYCKEKQLCMNLQAQ